MNNSNSLKNDIKRRDQSQGLAYHSDKGWISLDDPILQRTKRTGFKVYNEKTGLYETKSKREFIEIFLERSLEDNVTEHNRNIVSAQVLFYLTEKETILSTDIFSKGIFKFQHKFSREGGTRIELVGVYKEGFTFLLEAMGYYKRYKSNSDDYAFVQVNNNVMRIVTIERMKSKVYGILKELNESLTVEKDGKRFQFAKERLTHIFMENQHNIFNTNTCELLPSYDAPELKDSKEYSYFLFANSVVKVSKEGHELLPYCKLGNYCVWESHILPHEFHYQSYSPESTKYILFIHNVANRQGDRIVAFMCAIGYVLHHYNDSSMGQAVILYDEKPTSVDNPEGGTGKGLFAQSLALLKEMAKIDGKFFDPEDKFRYQSVKETTQIVFIDDLKPSIPFTTFFSALTDGWTIEKKHEKQIKLAPEQSPKLIFASNSVLGGTGTSDKRRQFILEFSDHYSKQIQNGTETPIIREHGGLMFDKATWDNAEWNRFYSFMLDCSKLYFQEGLKSYELKGVAANRLIQSCGEDFAEWIYKKNFEVNLEYHLSALYNEFLEFYYSNDSFAFKQRTFTENLKRYASIKGWRFERYHRGTHPNKIVAFQFRTQRR